MCVTVQYPVIAMSSKCADLPQDLFLTRTLSCSPRNDLESRKWGNVRDQRNLNTCSEVPTNQVTGKIPERVAETSYEHSYGIVRVNLLSPRQHNSNLLCNYGKLGLKYR